MFGTNYKFISDMTRKLDAGYKDIQEALEIEYFYIYDEKEKVFHEQRHCKSLIG